MNTIFNILLHTGIDMTVGIQLSKTEFRKALKGLSPKYRKQLLTIYKKYVKVLGNLPRGVKC